MKVFNSGLITDDFNVEGKVPVIMERFTIEGIVSTKWWEQDRDRSMSQMIERVNCRFRVRWQE